MKRVLLCIVALTVLLSVSQAAYKPAVLWHGMGDHAHSFGMRHLIKLIQQELPGIYVYSIGLGDGPIEDIIAGFLGDVMDQLATVHGDLAGQSQLAGGFNAVGLSQGGQFLRGYVQMYNDPPVGNLVTLGGQHQGVFGLPNCPTNVTACEITARLIDLGVYLPIVQHASVQAQYWHDSFLPHEYATGSRYIGVINQEQTVNQTYKDNLSSLDNLVLVKFLQDTVVEPSDSEWFEFYGNHQDTTIQPLQDTALWKDDLLGLQQLNNTGRLTFLGCPGNHLQFTDEWFIQNVIPYLNVTV